MFEFSTLLSKNNILTVICLVSTLYMIIVGIRFGFKVTRTKTLTSHDVSYVRYRTLLSSFIAGFSISLTLAPAPLRLSSLLPCTSMYILIVLVGFEMTVLTMRNQFEEQDRDE